MSHNSRTDLPLYEIYKELIDHMKSSGDYDIMRINLKDPIEKDKDYQRIIEKFREECERFCESVDLNQNRQTLRRKLGIRFESYSRSRSELIDLIRRSLNSKNQEIKDTYYAKARLFLKRFLPETTPSPPPISPTPIGSDTNNKKTFTHNGPRSSEPTVTGDAETKPDHRPEFEVELTKSSPELHPELIPIPLPPSPLPENPEPISICIPPPPPPLHKTPPQPPVPPLPVPPESELDTAVDMDISSSPEQNLQEDDELERMSLESVSSVKTADLSDFDNSIKLSDDEASIVGKPKNSKVPVQEIQENITKMNDLQLIQFENVKGPMDERSDVNETVEPMIQANESDGGCSETTTTGKRIARTRKSNPRYSNEHYIKFSR